MTESVLLTSTLVASWRFYSIDMLEIFTNNQEVTTSTRSGWPVAGSPSKDLGGNQRHLDQEMWGQRMLQQREQHNHNTIIPRLVF